jgi:hypothetical protein
MRRHEETVEVPELPVAPASEELTNLPGPEPEPVTEEPKRKRKRKRKPEEPEAPPSGVTPEDLERCQLALTTTFDIAGKVLAKKRGAHWLLDKEETEALGQVWTAALAPYLPKIGAAVPWATALVVTATMILPRLEADRALAQSQPAETPAAGPEIVR